VGDLALLILPVSACVLAAKANVPNVCWHKIVFKKCAVEKNKKHRVGQRIGLDAVQLLYFYVRVHLSNGLLFSCF